MSYVASDSQIYQSVSIRLPIDLSQSKNTTSSSSLKALSFDVVHQIVAVLRGFHAINTADVISPQSHKRERMLLTDDNEQRTLGPSLKPSLLGLASSFILCLTTPQDAKLKSSFYQPFGADCVVTGACLCL